jgi:hypothetical protein
MECPAVAVAPVATFANPKRIGELKERPSSGTDRRWAC